MDQKERDPQTYAIIGTAMTVHCELGPGFLEPVYQEALSLEFELANIPFERERRLPIIYRGNPLVCQYIADFICFESVIVETKAVSHLANEHTAQVINYLKATRLSKAILINFGAPSLEHKRLAN